MVGVNVDSYASVHAMQFVAFDVETTGYIAGVDHIIEIGAVRFSSDRVHAHFQHLIKPPIEIPQRLSDDVHGITDAMVQDAKTVETVIPQFMDFIQNTVLVAHNIDFDLRFINTTLVSLSMSMITNVPLVDTVRLARKVFPLQRNYKLETLVEELKLGGDDTFHRALEDAQHTRKLFLRCIDDMGMLGELEVREVLLI